MEVITIAARKGGDGKTTTAHNLGAGLILKGKKVLFVDLDTQRNLTRRVACLKAEKSILDALQATTADEIRATETKLTDNSSIIAGSFNLANYEKENAQKGNFDCVRKILKPFEGQFDYAIIDTAASFAYMTVAGLMAADKIVITMQPTADSLQGVQNLKLIIDSVRAKNRNNKPEVVGILPTMWKNRNITNAILDVAKKWGATVDYDVLEPIRDCVAIQEAELSQKDIFAYNKRCNAAIDYNKFVNDFLEG